MKIGVVYAVYNTHNGKLYIGKTTQSLQKRWSNHLCSAKRGNKTHLHRAIRKSGAGCFIVFPIYIARDIFLDAIEIYFIRSFNTMKEGYNETIGGDGGFTGRTPEGVERIKQANLGNKYSLGYKHSKESIEKISKAAKVMWSNPEYRELAVRKLLGRPADHLIGKKQSKETCLKRSDALKGRPWSDARRKAENDKNRAVNQ